jgi:hypothetical protein
VIWFFPFYAITGEFFPNNWERAGCGKQDNIVFLVAEAIVEHQKHQENFPCKYQVIPNGCFNKILLRLAS